MPLLFHKCFCRSFYSVSILSLFLFLSLPPSLSLSLSLLCLFASYRVSLTYNQRQDLLYPGKTEVCSEYHFPLISGSSYRAVVPKLLGPRTPFAVKYFSRSPSSQY